MDSFLHGFTEELVKEGAIGSHPLIQSIKRGGTALGQKVKGMASAAVRRARGIRAKTKGGAGLKKVTKPATIKKTAAFIKFGEMGDDDEPSSGGIADALGGDNANDVLKAIIEEAQARMGAEPVIDEAALPPSIDQSYGQSYGTGSGKRPPGNTKKPHIVSGSPAPRPKMARSKGMYR